MCTGSCAKCLGGSLITLACLCVLSNILLFFPGGKIAESNGHISNEVFYLGGLLGAGVLMVFPGLVFLGMKKNDCCGCCGNESCGKRFASFSSIIFAAIGLAGAAYSFIISAVSINKGPICYFKASNGSNVWGYPFESGNYLGNTILWKECLNYPPSPAESKINTEIIITWNLTLFSMLLIMSAVEAVLCAVQVINGLIGTICGDCKCCGCCGNDGPV